VISSVEFDLVAARWLRCVVCVKESEDEMSSVDRCLEVGRLVSVVSMAVDRRV
jgi:hypothetical protein